MLICKNKKSNDSNSPSERYRHTSNIYNNSMYIFGGKDNEEDELPTVESEREIFIYNFEKENWIKEIPKGNDLPRQTAGHTAVIYKNYLYIFGGIFTNFFPLNMNYSRPELHRYNFMSKTWEFIKYNGESLQLFGHTSIVYEDQMIVYGGGKDTGFQDEEQSSEIFIYEFQNELFKKIKQKNQIPQREGHSSILYKNKMIVFGGRSKDDRFNDLYQFNLSNHDQYHWSKILPKGSRIPSPRAGCSCCEWKDKLYVFGGFDGKFEMNELWLFNLKSNFWKECLILNDIPKPIGLHSCDKITNNEELKFYIFGGVAGDQLEDEYYNDFYEMIDSFGDFKMNLLNSILMDDYTDVVIKSS
eukprot:gene10958-3666_t